MQYNRYSSILIWAMGAILCVSCEAKTPISQTHHNGHSDKNSSSAAADPNDVAWIHPRSGERLRDRERMVDMLRGVYTMSDPNVLAAMKAVPRHWFVPENAQWLAYEDGPQSIGHGQTISQPFIVAFMTQVLDLSPEHKVLEIGTGSGYQAAVLTEFTPHVYTIEIVEPLGKRALEVFRKRGYHTIRAKIGDGYKGWPEYAPFDAIIVTCAPDHIPKPLIEQLKPKGRIVIPVGSQWGVQDLLLITKNKDGTLKQRPMMPVRFVPLTRDKK